MSISSINSMIRLRGTLCRRHYHRQPPPARSARATSGRRWQRRHVRRPGRACLLAGRVPTAAVMRMRLLVPDAIRSGIRFLCTTINSMPSLISAPAISCYRSVGQAGLHADRSDELAIGHPDHPRPASLGRTAPMDAARRLEPGRGRGAVERRLGTAGGRGFAGREPSAAVLRDTPGRSARSGAATQRAALATCRTSLLLIQFELHVGRQVGQQAAVGVIGNDFHRVGDDVLGHRGVRSGPCRPCRGTSRREGVHGESHRLTG